jgi:selenocysteine lyase/cysteine desulfurase
MPPKLRAATNEVPSRYETGTQPFELFAAVIGALEYYAWVGDLVAPRGKGLRARINRGKLAMQQHESVLALELIRGIQQLPGARIYGISDEADLDQRVSTVSFTLRGVSSQKIGAALAKREIYVWTGGFYAVDMIEKFGLRDSGGVVRVGPVHYNTVAEVQRFLRSMREIAK